MADEQHTKGPWNYHPTGETMQGYAQPFAVADDSHLNLVAGVFGDGRGGIEAAEANARLIAAAPDLLAACRVALQRLNPVYGPGREVPTVDHAIAALAEAIASATKPTGKDET